MSVYNNVCYCAAYFLLLSTGRTNWRKDIFAALGLFIPSLLLMDLVDWFQLAYPVLLAFVYRKDDGGYLQALARCFAGIFLLWLAIIGGYVLVLFLAPVWVGSTGYNIAMGAWVVASAILVSLWPKLGDMLRPGPSSRHLLGIQVLIISFFQLVFPLLDLAGRDPFRQAVYLASLLLLLLGVARFAAHAKAVEHRGRELELQRQREEEIKRQYEATIALRHYYSNLIGTMGSLIRDEKSDRLREYFEAHVAPAYSSSVADWDGLRNIMDEPLRRLIDTIIATVASTMPHVRLSLQVSGEIAFPPVLRRPVFAIGSVWLDNAVNSLKQQKTGKLEVSLTGGVDQVAIRIANTVPEDFSLADLHWEAVGDHGHGLRLVRETVAKYPQLESITKIDGSMIAQQLLVKGEFWHV